MGEMTDEARVVHKKGWEVGGGRWIGGVRHKERQGGKSRDQVRGVSTQTDRKRLFPMPCCCML